MVAGEAKLSEIVTLNANFSYMISVTTQEGNLERYILFLWIHADEAKYTH